MVDGASGAGPSRLMLIDADDSYLRMLEEMLVQCNYQVTTCQKVGIAFSLLLEKTRDYDLILSSANMPELEAFKLVYIIRFKLQIPVLLMSYDEEPNFVLKGMIARGSCGYLKKPIHIDTLRNLWHCDYLYGWQIRSRAIEQCEGWSRSTCYVPAAQTPNAAGEVCEVEIPLKGKKVLKKKKKSRTTIWTEKLHHLFEEAVKELGIDKAKPKKILSKMKVEGLKVYQVKRHWLLYVKKLEHSSEGVDEVVTCAAAADVPASASTKPCLHAGEEEDASSDGHGGGVVEPQRRISKHDPVEGKSVKKPYKLWTIELHEQFEKAVKELGGFDKATPKKIFDMMKAEGLTRRHIQNHWQPYRKKHLEATANEG